MSTSCPPLDERSRRTHALLLQRVQRVGQVEIARQTGTSESTVSRLVVEFERFARALTVLGVKVVPIENRCFPPARINAILTLAQDHLASIKCAADLADEDDPE